MAKAAAATEKAAMTRYQILHTNSDTIENFTAAQRRNFMSRCAVLRAQGVKFTTWDTRNNTMSSLFRF